MNGDPEYEALDPDNSGTSYTTGNYLKVDTSALYGDEQCSGYQTCSPGSSCTTVGNNGVCTVRGGTCCDWLALQFVTRPIRTAHYLLIKKGHASYSRLLIARPPAYVLRAIQVGSRSHEAGVEVDSVVGDGASAFQDKSQFYQACCGVVGRDL